MNKELQVAKRLVIAILSQSDNIESLDAILRMDDKKYLLSHISAIKNIFTKAEKQLKKELESEVTDVKD